MNYGFGGVDDSFSGKDIVFWVIIFLVLLYFIGIGIYISGPQETTTSEYVINEEARIHCKGGHQFIVNDNSILSGSTYTPVYDKGVLATCPAKKR